MSKREVLAPDGGHVQSSVTRYTDEIYLDRTGHTSKGLDHSFRLTEPEARHLARWLRDNGFLDDIVHKRQPGRLGEDHD
jgi:hypothetical protein